MTTELNDSIIEAFQSMDEYVKAKELGGRIAIKRILIANNGIAAVKAIRSIRKWSYETFENDRIISFVVMATPEDLAANAEYIRMADQYVEVPGGTNNNNYANVSRIVEIAEAAGADAVWAGWGHASENPSLPNRLKEKGILFLGPPSGPMKALGDKIDSTIIAQSACVPTLAWNGSDVRIDISSCLDEQGSITIPEEVYKAVTIQNIEEATEACNRVGFPLMLKASEGGGGKGIRTVSSLDELESAYHAVQSEVPGSPIFCMKLAEKCRHLEVQLLGDEYGNVIALSGRDCSVQRRHQKIIEEGPPLSPSDEVWRDMQLSAIRLAKLVGYTNAGTVEYLYMEDNTYSFLELNPRLQVEHPVTEMITNVNLPAAQLQIAMGIPLFCIPDIRRFYGESENATDPIDFSSIPPRAPRGHVIACRITAENPDAGFQPTSGAIQELNFRSTPNVWGYFSVDGSGRVHEYADSQFGHLFSWGTTRDTARKNMVQALREFSIRGEISTTIEYLLQLMQSEKYAKNDINTNWLDGLIRRNTQTIKPNSCFVALVACSCKSFAFFKKQKLDYLNCLKRGQIPSVELLSTKHIEELIYENTKYTLVAYLSHENIITIQANDSVAQIQLRELANNGFLLNCNGQSHVAYLLDSSAESRLTIDGVTCVFSQEYDPTTLRFPNSGKLARYLIQNGDHLKRGESYAEMEVMKMYLPLQAPEDCQIVQLVKPCGSIVQTGDVIGYVKVNDLSKVKKATVYMSPLPNLSIQTISGTSKPHHVVRSAMTVIESCLRGYSIPQSQVDFYLEKLVECAKDPSLPFYEYNDAISTIENKLPESLKTALDSALFRCPSYERNACVQKESFPSQMILQTLTRFITMAPNQAELSQVCSPLIEVVKKYSEGMSSFYHNCLLHLISIYVSNEEYWIAHQNDAFPKSSEGIERMWEASFCHARQKCISALVVELLHLLCNGVDESCDVSSRITKTLHSISILYSPGNAALSLEARQLLLQRKLPSLEDEITDVKNTLECIKGLESGDTKENELSKLISKVNDIYQSLMIIMDDASSSSIHSLALECYLRKIYQLYVLKSVASLPMGIPAFSFNFKSESSELPVGIRPSGSFSSQDMLSPRQSESIESSEDIAHGVIVLVDTKKCLQSLFPSILNCISPMESVGHSFNAIHIVLKEKEGNGGIYESIWSSYKEALEQKGVARITVTQLPSMALSNCSWDPPTSYTFRQRLEYHEDPLVRHIEPPLAYHLELYRLRNFSIRLIPLMNRNIHLYEATPKEATIVRGAVLPIRKRFFVRAVCSSFEPLATNKVTDTYPNAERVFVDALNALEIGIGESKLHGDNGNYFGNHIFLNVLPPTNVDPNLIEQVMKNLYIRYVKRLTALHVSQVEMRLLPVLSPNTAPVAIRMVGTDPTGMALHIDTYVETKDNMSNTIIFTSINENVNEAAGEWDGHSTSLAYPVLEPLERERAYAQKTSNTLYCYDYLDLIKRVMTERWKVYLRAQNASASVPTVVMKAKELELVKNESGYVLNEVKRSPGKNTIGMVAWMITLYTPTYPKDGREIMVICNDITFKAGSFGTKEDIFFKLVSEQARKLGIPRVFFAANSGARIGLAEEVKTKFKVCWNNENDCKSGVQYLYLEEEDYSLLSKSITATSIEKDGRIVHRIDSIIGAGTDLGVENLSGSGLIAGETSKAYQDIVTITVVTGRTVGIGAYLVRLGQRTIQKDHDSPIILTGYEALNQLMGRNVYSSNDQLGGVGIMAPNGITHLRVANDRDAVNNMLQWLSYTPKSKGAPVICQPLPSSTDTIDREVTFLPSKEPYDLRGLIVGNSESSGIFDKGSFMEVLADWAKTVIVGRARLGGIPVGVIATESRTIECRIPADPADPTSEETCLQYAGGVWYPDSSFKTAQAIDDINHEGLPLFILANWRGFSGGARDMYQEVLKFGSYIVDQLVDFHQPVFVYIPPYAELRGGAFVVIDSNINKRMMEMYAAPEARGGVLEPSGVVTIKFRESDMKAVMHRNDEVLQSLRMQQSHIECNDLKKEADTSILEREKVIGNAYHQVGELFADLHDRADRMLAVGTIRAIVDLRSSRKFFFWRLKRRLLEVEIIREIMKNADIPFDEATSVLSNWFMQSTRSRFIKENQWDNDEVVYHWLEQERSVSIQSRIGQIRKIKTKEMIRKIGEENPYTVTDSILELLDTLSGEVREKVVSTLKRGILLRNQKMDKTHDGYDYVEF